MSIDPTNLPPTGLAANAYRSYLVRFWRSNPHSPLRASTQCVQTGAVAHFADLPSLFQFLASLDAASPTAEPSES
jgi:hypothetical protein